MQAEPAEESCHMLLDSLSLDSSCLLLMCVLLSHLLFSPSTLCSFPLSIFHSHNMLSGASPALLLYCFLIAVSSGQDKLRLEKQNTETLSYKCDV